MTISTFPRISLVSLLALAARRLCSFALLFTLFLSISAGVLPTSLWAQGSSAPAFVAQPSDKTVAAGASATFEVQVTGFAPLYYRWERLPAGSSTWVLLSFSDDVLYSGIFSSALTVRVAGAGMNGDQFRCIVRDGKDITSTSASAMLRVGQGQAQAPVILTQPTHLTISTGSEGIFNVVAVGTAPLTYQWYQGNNRILGAVLSSYRIPSVQAGDAGNYYVEVSNISGTTRSQTATLLVVTVAPSVGTYAVTTVAGTPNVSGLVNGTGTNARFNTAIGIAVDAAGSAYIADDNNHVIRKVTAAGAVTTFAGIAGGGGSNDGTTTARFLYPKAVAADADGNVYVADTLNHTIRKITPAGLVSTLAGSPGSTGSTNGTGSAARFNMPQGIAVDKSGNIYVTERVNHTIRKITPAGVVTTLAGTAGVVGTADGTGTAARFNAPTGIGVDTLGNVYVADTYNYTLRKITPSGVVSTLVGVAGTAGSSDGAGQSARLRNPNGVAVDLAGNIYIADGIDATIRKVTPAGYATTIAGLAGLRGTVDGVGADARLHTPYGIAVTPSGDLLISDVVAFVIRKATFLAPPQIGVHPSDTTVNAGANATFAINAVGTAPLSYQWQAQTVGQSTWTNMFDLVSVAPALGYSGVKTATLTIHYASTALSGTRFRCVVTNARGNQSSEAATLTVIPLAVVPSLTSSPVSQTVTEGQSAQFSLSAAGTTPLTYRWYAQSGNGSWVDLTTDASASFTGAATPTLTFPATTLAQNGLRLRAQVSNSAGSVTTDTVTLTVNALPAVTPSRLTNLSVRAYAGSGDDTLIMGFVMAGSGEKSFLVRAAGPALSSHNLILPQFILPDPKVTLNSVEGPELAQNDTWGGTNELQSAAQSVGAFAFPEDSKDAALLKRLGKGGYTAVVTPADSAHGVALAEVYDTDASNAQLRLINLSARNLVRSEGGVYTVIVGFSITGTSPKKVLLRGVGPTLKDHGVDAYLATPKISLYESSGTLITQNDHWNNDPAILTAAAQSGAFPLKTDSRDAALLVTLAPGGYTVLLTSSTNAIGVALAEIYEVP